MDELLENACPVFSFGATGSPLFWGFEYLIPGSSIIPFSTSCPHITIACFTLPLFPLEKKICRWRESVYCR